MRTGSHFRHAAGPELPAVARILGEAFREAEKTRAQAAPTPRDRTFSGLHRVLLERAAEAGHVLVDHAGTAAAAFLPPGRPSEPATLRENVDRALAQSRAGAPAIELSGIWEGCWSLEIIGVTPKAQHRGLGSELLRFGLRTIAREHRDAFVSVETSDPRSVPFFLRHGFVLLETCHTADVPVTWSLLSGPVFEERGEESDPAVAPSTAPRQEAPIPAAVPEDEKAA